MPVAYQRGLHELGDGLHAYLQPDGSWGWSNAGLITAGGTSLLVDTLFDLELTREMLDAMRPITERSPIDAAMNTHGNGDHCFGNELLPEGAEIYATVGAAAELQAAPPQLVDALKHADAFGPELTAYIQRIFGPFRFEGIELRLPTSTFEGRLELTVGDRAVHFVEVGPAHTDGDAIVQFKKANVIATGDVVGEGYPLIDADSGGTFDGFITAAEKVLSLADDNTKIVPGHGPLMTKADVTAYRDMLLQVRERVGKLIAAKKTVEEAKAAKPLADLEPKWGQGFIHADFIIESVYKSPPAPEKKGKRHGGK